MIDCRVFYQGSARFIYETDPGQGLINTDGDPRNDYAEWLADTDGADGMRTATIDTTAPRRFMRLVVED